VNKETKSENFLQKTPKLCLSKLTYRDSSAIQYTTADNSNGNPALALLWKQCKPAASSTSGSGSASKCSGPTECGCSACAINIEQHKCHAKTRNHQDI
jgi:hypothetical protein